MLRNVRIGLRLLLMVMVMLLALALVAGSALRDMRAQLLEERKRHTRELVDVAIRTLHRAHTLQLSGRMSEEEAKQHAARDLEALRYDGGNYFWASDLRPVLIAHPMEPHLVGRNLGDLTDAGGLRLFHEFAERARSGGGYVLYQWRRPGGSAPEPKLSYVEMFEPWQWVVGSGLYMGDLAEIEERALWRFGAMTAGATGVAVLLLWLLGRTITRPLSRVTAAMSRLANGHEDVEVPETSRRDEIGALMRAMAVFKHNHWKMEEMRHAREDEMRVAATVLETISEGVIVTDADNRIKAVNPAFSRTTGYTLAEVLGQSPNLLSSGKHDDAFYKAMWSDVLAKGTWSGEIWNRRKDGVVYLEWLSIHAVRNAHGAVIEYVATLTDITHRKAQEQKIRWQAEHDPLTGLINRIAFEERLERAVADAHEDGSVLGLLFIDLDRFKEVNDTLGHAAGDALLQATARRLRGCVRTADTVARLGGDEFVVLLPGLARPDAAAQVARKILHAMVEPQEIAGARVRVGASVGVAILDDDHTSAAELMRRADEAMYRIKSTGRGNFAFDREPFEPAQ